MSSELRTATVKPAVAFDDPLAVTFLRAKVAVTKTFHRNENGSYSIVRGAAKPKHFRMIVQRAETIEQLCAGLQLYSKNPIGVVFDMPARDFGKDYVRRCGDTLIPVKRRIHVFDVDAPLSASRDLETAFREIRPKLPEGLRDCDVVLQASASFGLSIDGRPAVPKMHVWVICDEPIYPSQADAWRQRGEQPLDSAPYHTHQLTYFQRPAFDNCDDPIKDRFIVVKGADRYARVPGDLPVNVAKSHDRALQAPDDVEEDAPQSIDRFVELLARRKIGESRHVALFNASHDARDLAIDEDIAKPILLAWTGAEGAAGDLRDALVAVDYPDVEDILARLARCARKNADRWAEPWEGAETADDAIDRMWDDAAKARRTADGSAFLTVEALAELRVNEADSGKGRAEMRMERLGDLWAAPDLGEGTDGASDKGARGEAPRDVPKAKTMKLAGAVRRLREVVNLGRESMYAAEADLLAASAHKHDNPALEHAADALFDTYALGGDRDAALVAVTSACDEWEKGERDKKADAAFTLPAPWRITADSAIPPRRFVYDKWYVRSFPSSTISPGGRGKSALLIAEAVAMAVGVDLYGNTIKPLRVFYFNGEDPQEEIDRRIYATLKHRGLTADALGDRLYTKSGRDASIKIAEPRDGRPTIRDDAAKLESMLRALKIDVAIFDPFVSLHLGNENDTVAVDLVVKELGRIAGALDASVMLAHHTRKPGQDNSDGQITTDDSRGAKALIDACRVQRLLNPLREKIAQTWGIGEADRWRYIAMTDGKANLSPRGMSSWFKLESQQIDNATDDYPADNVGAAIGWLAPDAVNRGTDDQEKIAAWLALNGNGEEVTVKAVCEATGLPLKNFRRDVLSGRDDVTTSYGKLVMFAKTGRASSLIRLAADDGWSKPDISSEESETD